MVNFLPKVRIQRPNMKVFSRVRVCVPKTRSEGQVYRVSFDVRHYLSDNNDTGLISFGIQSGTLFSESEPRDSVIALFSTSSPQGCLRVVHRTVRRSLWLFQIHGRKKRWQLSTMHAGREKTSTRIRERLGRVLRAIMTPEEVS